MNSKARKLRKIERSKNAPAKSEIGSAIEKYLQSSAAKEYFEAQQRYLDLDKERARALIKKIFQ